LYLVKQIEEESGFNEIDLTVSENNRWFRLPNQSNKEKPTIHSIVNGQMSGYLLDLIQPKSSILTIEVKKDIKPKIKREIFELTDINKTYETDKQIYEMLNILPADYLDEYSKWIIITNILKGQDKFDIWDNWSKQLNAYNVYKNKSIWRATKKITYDVSYLVKMTDYSLFKTSWCVLILFL
jgi:hypothetical protein